MNYFAICGVVRVTPLIVLPTKELYLKQALAESSNGSRNELDFDMFALDFVSTIQFDLSGIAQSKNLLKCTTSSQRSRLTKEDFVLQFADICDGDPIWGSAVGAFKVWLVTACSSGFGKEIVLAALARGDRVIATARDASKLQDLVVQGARALMLDVTASDAELQKVIAEALSFYGTIDILVN
ncbi:unnamed protein product [Peronospora belbahrii]|uniref:Ketoreductase (KR) domain-containing protein n=1 Tax=Peronospora belbahrii TaxID=622444 RepID=A0AAU9KSJ3_9STRA|nr:unnamed protein product [Peronospora belbahrii]